MGEIQGGRGREWGNRGRKGIEEYKEEGEWGECKKGKRHWNGGYI